MLWKSRTSAGRRDRGRGGASPGTCPLLERQVFSQICVSYLEVNLKSLLNILKRKPDVNR